MYFMATGEAFGAADYYFPSRVQMDVILIFTIQFFKNASRWTYCSVRSPYSTQQCIL